MKNFVLLAIAPIFLFVFALFPLKITSAKSQSQSEYACVLTSDAYFYPDSQGKRGLFILPKTYFVKVLEIGDSFCRVEYLYDEGLSQKIVGFVRTEELTFVDFIPQNPYPYKVFEVSYRLDNTDGSGSLDEIVLTCVYYGDYAIGSEEYCYVLRGEDFGYIPRPIGLTVEPNDEYAKWQAQTTPPSSDEPREGTSTPTQTAVLVALCLLVPILASLILRPHPDTPYEE